MKPLTVGKLHDYIANIAKASAFIIAALFILSLPDSILRAQPITEVFVNSSTTFDTTQSYTNPVTYHFSSGVVFTGSGADGDIPPLTGFGGAIASSFGLVMNGADGARLVFLDNSSDEGGALGAETVNLNGNYDSIILSSNTADIRGGGAISSVHIRIGNADSVISGSLVLQGNIAPAGGGALHSYEEIALLGSYGTLLIDGNTAPTGAGGAFHATTDITFNASTIGSGTFAITNNSAGTNGGAFYSGGVTTISGSAASFLVASNTATGRGGAFYSGGNFTLSTAADTIFTATNNKASTAADGGFLWLDSGTATLDIAANALLHLGDANSLAATTDSIGGNATTNVTQTNDGTIIYHADNSAYAGAFNLNRGIAQVSSTRSLLGGALNGTGTLALDNANAANTGADFLFTAAQAAGNFSGVISLQNSSTYTISNIAAASPTETIFQRSTLRLSAPGITADPASSNGGDGSLIVDQDARTIGNLDLAGGKLLIRAKSANTAESNILNVTNLTSTAGGTVIGADASVLAGIDISGSNQWVGPIFNLTGTLVRQLINVTGAVDPAIDNARFTLVDAVTGTAFSAIHTQTFKNTASGNDVGVAHVGYIAQVITTGSMGLWIGTGVTQIDSTHATERVIISSTSTLNSGTNQLMIAKLSGAGAGFEFTGGNTITLLNLSGNDYTGATSVTAATTLRAGTDTSLGATSLLSIDATSAFDLNGFSQTIGALGTTLGSTLSLNGGELTLLNGGTSNGALTGSGQINTSGALTINGANLALTANIHNTGTATLTNTAALGNAGTLTNDNLVQLDTTAPAAILAKTISGTGAVALLNATNIAVTATNADFSGTWNIASSAAALFATSTANLGTASIANSGTFTIANTAAETLANALSGTGAFIKDATGNLTISQSNAFTGATLINSGTLTLENLAGVGTGNIANNAALILAETGTFANNLSGTGVSYVSYPSHGSYVVLSGSNAAFTGQWQIGSSGTAEVSTQQNLGTGSVNIAQNGQLVARAASPWVWANQLTGSGILKVDTSGNAFSFQPSTFSPSAFFTGTLQLANTLFSLAGDNTAALAAATLQLDSGNLTTVGTVGTGTQQIGNLTLNGGRLDFASTLPADATAVAFIATDILNITSGTIAINLPATPVISTTIAQLPLLQQDEGNGLQLVSATTALGDVNALVLIDAATGSAITNARTSDITQNGTAVATGTYDYRLASNGLQGSGLYAAYALTAVDIHANQTLSLDQDATAPAGADNLTASITGAGNLAINALGSITLTSAANTYTGTTLVNSGTLTSGANNALGQTAALVLAANSAFDLSGKTQTIGALNTAAASTLNLNSGSLAILSGGTANGVLTGNGTLDIVAGALVITNANPNLAAAVNIATSATARLTDAAGLGNGSVKLGGSLILDINSALQPSAFSPSLSGSGALIKTGSATATISSVNTDFTGTTFVQSGTLSATNIAAVGATPIITSSNATFEFRNIASGTVVNTISGPGALAIANSTLAISSSNNIAAANLTAATVTMLNNNALGNATTIITLDAPSKIIIATPGTAQLGTLNLNSGTLAFAPNTAAPTTFRTANIAQLGTAGTLVFNVNFEGATGLNAAGTRADYLTITNSGTAAHTVHIDPTGNPTADKTSIELINATAGTATFALDNFANKIDVGMNSFELTKGDATTPLLLNPNSWYLASTGPSNAADAILNTASMLGADWFYSLDSLHQRMGDIRLETVNRKLETENSDDASGGVGSGNVWVRARGYQINADNELSGKSFKQYGYGLTAGADKSFTNLAVNSTVLLGALIDMGNIDRQFVDRGEGESRSISVGLYATWLHRDGWYADFVAKADRYKNDFDARAVDQQVTSGRYTSHTQGLSLEIGRTIKRANGWWFEPNLQAATVWLNGASYNTTSATQQSIHVKVDNSTAQQYRAQLRFGRQLLDTKWYPYAKLAAVAVDGSGGTITAEDESLRPNYTGKRVEVGFGTAYKINANSQVYLDYEYAKAAAYERPWSFNLGYRRVW